MAKRKRTPRLGHVTETEAQIVEDYITERYRRADSLHKNKYHKKAYYEEERAEGVRDVARRMGVRCYCRNIRVGPRKIREICGCGTSDYDASSRFREILEQKGLYRQAEKTARKRRRR